MPISGTSTSRSSACRPSLDQSALLVIDVQNDFASHDGWFGQRGADLSFTTAMLPRLQGLIDYMRSRATPVIFTCNWHREATDSPALIAHLERHGSSPMDRPARADTWGAAFCGVKPTADEEVVRKFRYDAFLGTNLDYLLRARGVETVFCAGTTTNVCVESTARSAFMRNYHVVLVEDCCAAYDFAEHQASVRNIECYFGVVLTSDQLRASG
jgi:ureidoacrylate peracid hydrolase